MMDSFNEQNYVDIPQWKKDLIARLKNSANKTVLTASSEQCNNFPQLSPRSEVSTTIKSTSDVAVLSRGSELYSDDANRSLSPNDHKIEQNGEESDSDDLHYGPGIVKKLKNKYLSLALRESNPRPSILHLRKATSLENVLEDEGFSGSKQYESHDRYRRKNNVPKRYGIGNRTEMKRARSVETISRLDDTPASAKNNNRQSFHEVMLVDNEIDICLNKFQNNSHVDLSLESKCNTLHINRPKRLQPIMNENEKPPPEFVKQAKMLFERRPEQRTRPPVQTGDVAAKVHNFNTIIVKAKVEAKVFKKQLNKHNKSASKTSVDADQHRSVKTKSLLNAKTEIQKEPPLSSPIPDVSMIEFPKNGVNENQKNNSLSETPDLILTSSPVLNASLLKSRSILLNREEFENPTQILDNNFPKRLASPASSPTSLKPARPPSILSQNQPLSPPKSPNIHTEYLDSLVHQMNEKNTDSFTNVTTLESNVPISHTLKIDKKEFVDNQMIETSPRTLARSPEILKASAECTLIKTDIDNVKSSVMRAKAVNKNVLVNKTMLQDQSPSTVYNFKDRTDVPDYISNNQARTVSSFPKPGEAGTVLLPTSNIELLIDEDEELIKSLQGPPSPCDVIFINDNILIDGKSNFIQKNKQNKLNISFVDKADVYEYPSENSLMLEEGLSSPQAQMGSSMLSNYIPKVTEEFQPGVTRSIQTTPSCKPDIMEVEQSPIVLIKETNTPFSSGSNPDILF